MPNLLDDVNELLNKNYGDEFRLLHIKEAIEENKILYESDRQFLTNLCKKYLGQKNPEYKSQKYIKYSEKSDDQLYSENENILGNENMVVNENTLINKNTIGNDESNLGIHKIRESNIFCNNCGNKILEKTQFCTDCGHSLDNTPQTNSTNPQSTPQSTPQSNQQHPMQGGRPSAAWWLLPIFFSIIGGIIVWACIRDRDPRMAKNNLILGIILTVLPLIVVLIIFLGFITIPYSGLDAFR